MYCKFISKVVAQNCAYAPSCPDLVTWKAGFVCGSNLMPIVKTRFINGNRTKTICCKGKINKLIIIFEIFSQYFQKSTNFILYFYIFHI